MQQIHNSRYIPRHQKKVIKFALNPISFVKFDLIPVSTLRILMGKAPMKMRRMQQGDKNTAGNIEWSTSIR